MTRKYKMTGCARFFIFLLVFTPLVLIGVSYFNGNNPIQQVKELLNIETGTSDSKTTKSVEPRETGNTSSSSVSSEGILKSTIETQRNTIEELRTEVKNLEKQLKDKDREIQFLKQSGNE